MKKRGESKVWGGVRGKTYLKLEKTKGSKQSFPKQRLIF